MPRATRLTECSESLAAANARYAGRANQMANQQQQSTYYSRQNHGLGMACEPSNPCHDGFGAVWTKSSAQVPIFRGALACCAPRGVPEQGASRCASQSGTLTRPSDGALTQT